MTVLVLPVDRLALFGSPDLVFIDGGVFLGGRARRHGVQRKENSTCRA